MKNRELIVRQLEKQARRLERRRRIRESISQNGGDILHSVNFQKTRKNMQHGRVSVHSHSISVAECSLSIREKLQKLGIRSEERDIIRGALLHDYFLYDWHNHIHKKGWRNLHGFTHPETALNNARKEYQLSPREQDIIKKHMWPLTLVPPLCREAWIVTAADKYCSFLETVEPRLEQMKHLGRHWAVIPRKVTVRTNSETPENNSGQEANGRNTSADK